MEQKVLGERCCCQQ